MAQRNEVRPDHPWRRHANRAGTCNAPARLPGKRTSREIPNVRANGTIASVRLSPLRMRRDYVITMQSAVHPRALNR